MNLKQQQHNRNHQATSNSRVLQRNTGILLFSWKHMVHQDHFLPLLPIPVRVPRPESRVILPTAKFILYNFYLCMALHLCHMNCHVYLLNGCFSEAESKLIIHTSICYRHRYVSPPSNRAILHSKLDWPNYRQLKFLPSACRDSVAECYLWELIFIWAVEVVLLNIALADDGQGLGRGLLSSYHTLHFRFL